MSLRAVTIVAAVLLLAGCTPGPAPSPTPTAAGSSSGAEPTASVPPTVEIISPDDYLVDGTPGVVGADGTWKGHYAFFADASKAVRCDIYIFSGDSGGVTCAVTPGNESKVTYMLPPADCAPEDGNPVDGYSAGINYKVFTTGNSGWTGCGLGASEFAGVTKVLPEGQDLLIESPAEKYTCSVAGGVAACFDAQGSGFHFGLSNVDFVE